LWRGRLCLRVRGGVTPTARSADAFHQSLNSPPDAALHVIRAEKNKNSAASNVY
jgi:hypothetical protein